MNEKRADNSINTSYNINNDIYVTKKKISNIDNRIDIEKNKIKELDDMEELFMSLNKNISKCVDLLNRSVKGKTVNAKLNAIEEHNKVNFARSLNNIEIQRDEVKSNLVKLNEEKEKFQEILKEKYIDKERIEDNKHKDDEIEERKDLVEIDEMKKEKVELTPYEANPRNRIF